MRESLICICIIISLVVFLMSCQQAGTPGESSKAIESRNNSKAKQPICEYYLEGGSTGILLIHGYGASSLTMKPIAHALNKCGYTVFCALLPGHGTSVEDLEKVEKNDYYRYIDKAYKKFVKKVDRIFVVGHSLGSLLTIRLSVRHKLDGIILVSPPILVLGEEMTEDEIHEAALLIGRLLGKLPRPNPTYIMSPDYFEKYGVYSEFPPQSLEVLAAVLKDAKQEIKKVDDPLLVILGRFDPLVDMRTGDYIAKIVKSHIKQTAIINSIGHRFFLGEKMPDVVKDISKFINYVEKAEEKSAGN